MKDNVQCEINEAEKMQSDFDGNNHFGNGWIELNTKSPAEWMELEIKMMKSFGMKLT